MYMLICAIEILNIIIIIIKRRADFQEVLSGSALLASSTEPDVLSSPRGGGGRYSSEFLVGVCRPVPQILTQFQTKTCHFPHPFSDFSSKIQTRFQTFVLP